jgi:cyclophilin family peptidyl-prolyl cis-trans isomerase
MEKEFWKGFTAGTWQTSIDVRDFIQKNYREYTGDDKFLAKATERTNKLMKKVNALFSLERQFGGVLDVDTTTVSSLTSYAPGYIDEASELIVGLQTNRPLRRGVNPFGGMRMVKQACEAYGYSLSEKVKEEFRFRTTHNDGVFRAYTEEMRLARKCHVITGLPDAYGRGRIIGDYRRVALYGVDKLIEEKQKDKDNLANADFYDGLTFHRIMDGFMMQGGDPEGTGSGGSTQSIQGEFAANGVTNTLSHTRGVISMARATDLDSASSQFFIVHEDSTFLDGNYAAFGWVTAGMDVVKSFTEVEMEINAAGEQASPKTPIKIKSITIK